MNNNLARRKVRTHAKMTDANWRITVSRSIRYLAAQLIEVQSGKIKIGAIDHKIIANKAKMTKTDRATEFGKWFGTEINKLKIDKLVFDRNGRRYHGRIKAFAEGLRSIGVKI